MAVQNKLFNVSTIVSTGLVARKRMNREYMLSKSTAEDLNTYKNFGIFPTWNDVGTPDWDSDTLENKEYSVGTPGVRSIFNKYSATLTGANEDLGLEPGASVADQKSAMEKLVLKPQEFRIHNNVPLLDTPDVRRQIRQKSGCSVKELVENSKKGYYGRNGYSYADFMYCKYLGRVPNNHLITLRRFPAPVGDSLMPFGVGKSRRSAAGRDTFYQPIGTMVTWFGVSDNDMKTILSYSYHQAWRELDAQWEDTQNIGGGQSSLLNGMEAMINPAMRKSFQTGESSPVGSYMSSFFPGTAGGNYNNWSDNFKTDRAKVYGPIDRVKKTYARSEAGLDFNQSFTLNFDYELRAYNGINPRAAMVDLIASILSVTYTTGGFWGGGYRGGGMRQSSTFSNLNVFKAHGGFTDYMDALSKDISGSLAPALKNAAGSMSSNPFEVIKSALNMIGGMLFGGILNKLGRPKKYFANSLLSEAPVGLWHITIGNPNHPIMTMGNMILKDVKIEHSGPLGLDDFPTNLRVSCTFDRGKPRDQAGIEAMYMHGNDRIFHSMSDKLQDMYDAAAKYKGIGSALSGSSVSLKDMDPDAEVGSSTTATNPSEVSSKLSYMEQVFGSFTDYGGAAAIITAREQAEGGFKKSSSESTS